MLWLILLVLLFVAVISFNQYTKNKKKYKAGEMGETEVYQLITQIAPRSSVILRNIYLPTSKGTTETDLLMLTRKGIFVFEIKNYRGVIYGDERYNEWIKVLGNGKKVSFYNPVWQNEGHIRALLRLFPEINPRFVYSRIVFCGSSEIKRVRIKNRSVRVLKDTELKRKMKWKLRFSFNKFSGRELAFFEQELQKFTDMNGRTKRKHKKQVKSLKRQYPAG